MILIFSIKVISSFYIELRDIKRVQSEQFEQHLVTNQFLLSTIDWSSRRTRVILFMRDCIVEQWKNKGVKYNIEEAYAIAESIMKECDNYEYIDPFFVLALQCIESKFNRLAVSPMGAIGICQIMPTTGKLLAGYFGIEYTDSLLFNLRINIKFAVKLIDFLYSQYSNWEQVLADYNGGPWQAYYYRYNKSKLTEETKNFVPNVLKKKGEYDSLFMKYKIEEKINNYISSYSNYKLAK